jgi:tetratricopeptide (TPR) repeat protein
VRNPCLHIISVPILLLLWGCSPQKNTAISRAYNDVTAKYNVLFNGNESYKKGLAKIDEGFKDDYSEILPVFKYGSKDALTLASSDMDRVIKKCTKCITLHSITAKPKVKGNKNLTDSQRDFYNRKEYNAFVDDAYLLMAKAYFYKQEFELSSDFLRKVINDYKDHPVVYEAQLWLARLQVQSGDNINALDILSSLTNNAEFPKKLLPDLYTTLADYHLKLKNYPEAIQYLEKTLTVEKHKKVRSRYLYILAQLYEKTGDLKKASEYYARVIETNPPYEMTFNALINRALAYEQGFGQVGQIETELLKMLRDDKNIEYQDQIYYALGNLEAKEGKYDKALEYYHKSINVNKGNNQQKVRSYLTIANYYYSKPDYLNSQAYYDSAVTFIQPDYPGYDALVTKSNSLTRLVEDINTVKLSDSVLILAQLPKEEMMKRVDAVMEAERKKEELARQKENKARQNEQEQNEITQNELVRQRTNPMTSPSASSGWYFYNDQAKSMGYREFKLRWGNRKLEDHWQRSVKAAVFSTAAATEEDTLNVVEKAPDKSTLNRNSRDYYLVDIPLTDSAVQVTHKRTQLALYNMGGIYKDELKDYDKAIESYKELINRYPSSVYLLPAYKNLYDIAKAQNNPAMVDYYKNTIISRFPESTYAKVLTDPNYFVEIEKKEKAVQQYYEQTYNQFMAGNYSEVIARTNNALRAYPRHALLPQFEYLGILAKGKMEDRSLFRTDLVAIADKYAGTDIASDAKNLINYMDKEHPELKEAEEIKKSEILYQELPGDSLQYFLFVVDKKLNTNQLVFNVINFNLDQFDDLGLMVEIVNLDDEQNMIRVKTFRNKQLALKYMKSIKASMSVFKDIPASDSIIPVVISEQNFKTLQEDKSISRYLKFFNEHTLNDR